MATRALWGADARSLKRRLRTVGVDTRIAFRLLLYRTEAIGNRPSRFFLRWGLRQRFACFWGVRRRQWRLLQDWSFKRVAIRLGAVAGSRPARRSIPARLEPHTALPIFCGSPLHWPGWPARRVRVPRARGGDNMPHRPVTSFPPRLRINTGFLNQNRCFARCSPCWIIYRNVSFRPHSFQ